MNIFALTNDFKCYSLDGICKSHIEIKCPNKYHNIDDYFISVYGNRWKAFGITKYNKCYELDSNSSENDIKEIYPPLYTKEYFIKVLGGLDFLVGLTNKNNIYMWR